MKHAQYFALAAGMLLLLSGILTNASALRKEPTAITLEFSSSVVNSNDTVTFTGTLVNAETGEGLRDKKITIYREGSIVPEPIAEGNTGIDGAYTITWVAEPGWETVTFATVLAQFDGDETAEPARTGKSTFKITLMPINLTITTNENRNRYQVGEKALFSVAIHDGMGNFIDPDILKATYDGNFISLDKVEVGRYTFETPTLVKFEQHQFGIFAVKSGHDFAQESATITVFGAAIAKPVKVTASKIGDDVMIRVSNSALSPGHVYTFEGKLLFASAVGASVEKWQFNINPIDDSFNFKSLSGSLSQGKYVSFKVKVDGAAMKLLWKVLDLHGVELASGTTVVKPIRPK